MEYFRNKITYLTISILISLIITLGVLEIVFHTILIPAKFPVGEFEEKDSILKFEPFQEGVFTRGKFCEGKINWKINNAGWNSSIDYKETDTLPLIAIIGDSYVEAFQVNLDSNFSAVIRRGMKNKYRVYSFGTSGAPLSQYFQIYKYVTKHYHPEIVIFNVVHNDFAESLFKIKSAPGFLYTEINKDSAALFTPLVKSNPIKFYSRIAFTSSTINYLINNLKIQSFKTQKVQSKIVTRFNSNIDVDQTKKMAGEIYQVTNFILKNMKQLNPQCTLMVVMDAPRQEIYNNIPYRKSNIYWINDMLSVLCKKNEINFLDLSDGFSKKYATDRQRFEFSNDWHWNSYGHQNVADQIMKYMSSNNLIR